MSATQPQIYEFGRFRLDRSERELWCDGRPVALTEKAFELLSLLVQSRGRALTKLELMSQLWPDTVVQENNLTVQVSALRKALGEGAAERRYIETLARRGYRFVAEVRTSPAPAVASQGAPIENERMPHLFHNDVGDLYLELSLPARALDEHTRALEIARRHALRAGQLHALIGLARGYDQSCDSERAHTELERAEQLLHELRSSVELTPRNYELLRMHLDAAWADYRLREGALDAAERHAQDLLTAANEYGSLRHTARAHHALARAGLSSGDLPRAEAQVRSGLAALAGQRHPLLRSKLLATLGAIHQRAGAVTGAAAARAAAQAIVDQLSAAILDPDLRADWLRSPGIAELAVQAAARSAS